MLATVVDSTLGATIAIIAVVVSGLRAIPAGCHVIIRWDPDRGAA